MADEARLSLLQRPAGYVLVVEAYGPLTAGPDAVLMKREMDHILNSGPRRVLLHLGRVQFMDSTGLGVLLAVKTSAINRGVELKVCNVPRFVEQLLNQLHLSKILDVHDQEAAALESFDAGMEKQRAGAAPEEPPAAG